jgi:soluble lytic murein transglycosylase-like protein
MKIFLIILLVFSKHAIACWERAAERHGVDPMLLFAIAKVESSLNPAAVNRSHTNRTSSYDIGLMQINSSHLPRLAKHGIYEKHLYDACTNIDVGAWILSDVIQRHGYNWNAIGAYNAACVQLKGKDCVDARATYANKVYRALNAASLKHKTTKGSKK